jgi:hypothetical protein
MNTSDRTTLRVAILLAALFGVCLGVAVTLLVCT